MTGRNPIDPDIVHGYVDNQLDSETELEVGLHFASHPEQRVLVDEYRSQVEAIRALYEHVLSEPVPERLSRLLSAADAPEAPPSATDADPDPHSQST